MKKDYQTFYRLLGIDSDSGAEQIRAAFRRLSKIYHPDMNNNSEDSGRTFILIHNAYRILSDEEKRREYDEYLKRSSYAEPPLMPDRKPLESRFPSAIPGLISYINIILWEIDDLLNISGADAGRNRLILIILTFLDKWILEPCGFPDYFFEARGLNRHDPREYINILAGGIRAGAHMPYRSTGGYYYDVRKRADRFISKYSAMLIQEDPAAPSVSLSERIIEFHNMSIHYLNYLLDKDSVCDGAPGYAFSNDAFTYNY